MALTFQALLHELTNLACQFLGLCKVLVELRLCLAALAVYGYDLLHLLGYQTRMTRTSDVSIYTTGDTIARKKRMVMGE